MSLREKIAMNFGIWLCIYPTVLIISGLFEWLDLGWSMWLEILISTSLTVPLISWLAVPAVRTVIAEAEGKDVSELGEG